MRRVWLVLLVTAACGGGGAGPELALDAGGAASAFRRGSSPAGDAIAVQVDAGGARDAGALERPPAADAGADEGTAIPACEMPISAVTDRCGDPSPSGGTYLHGLRCLHCWVGSSMDDLGDHPPCVTPRPQGALYGGVCVPSCDGCVAN